MPTQNGHTSPGSPAPLVRLETAAPTEGRPVSVPPAKDPPSQSHSSGSGSKKSGLGKRLKRVNGWFRQATNALWLGYGLVVGLIVLSSMLDPTKGPGRTGDDLYFDRHAELYFLAATGTLAFGQVYLRTPGHLSVEERVAEQKTVLGLTVLLTGYCIALAMLWERQGLAGVAMMGLVILVTTLLGGNILSEKKILEVHEVRTAITLTTVAMFFAMLGFAPEDVKASGTVLGEAVDHFWAVVATVVAFYFGSHTVEKLWGNRAKGDEEEDEGEEDKGTDGREGKATKGKRPEAAGQAPGKTPA
jgi:hypothetical protein